MDDDVPRLSNKGFMRDKWALLEQKKDEIFCRKGFYCTKEKRVILMVRDYQTNDDLDNLHLLTSLVESYDTILSYDVKCHVF